MILPILYIAHTHKKGRGVFTAEFIPAQTTIEISPVIILTAKERKIIEETKLYNYIFEWGMNKKKGAIGMGYISMYNHNYNANCIYEMDYVDETMSIITIKDVQAGEELCINYNADPTDITPIWFDAH
jgi:SET domain-containing protein